MPIGGPGEFIYRPGTMGGGAYGSYEQLGMSAPQAQVMAAAKQAEFAKYQADLQRQTTQQQLQAENERARIAAETARFPELMKQQRFSQILSGLTGGGFGIPGAPGGGRVGIQPFPGPGAGGGGGTQGQAFLNIPGRGLVAPPGVPGSALAPSAPTGGGGFGGGFFGGFGGGFGGGGGQFDVDRTLPEFSADPFSRSRQRQAVGAMRASTGRQLGTEQKNITQQAAARGFSGASPQVMALQSRARQASRAGELGQQREIGNQYNMGRAQLEQQRQGLLAQRRTDIDKARAGLLSAQYGPQAQMFSSLLGSI